MQPLSYECCIFHPLYARSTTIQEEVRWRRASRVHLSNFCTLHICSARSSWHPAGSTHSTSSSILTGGNCSLWSDAMALLQLLGIKFILHFVCPLIPLKLFDFVWLYRHPGNLHLLSTQFCFGTQMDCASRFPALPCVVWLHAHWSCCNKSSGNAHHSIGWLWSTHSRASDSLNLYNCTFGSSLIRRSRSPIREEG